MLSSWWFDQVWGEAAPIEVLWVVTSLVGLAISSVNLHRSMKTIAYLDVLTTNGLLRIAAKAIAIEEAMRTAVQGINVAVGMIAIFWSRVFFQPVLVGGKTICWLLLLNIIILAVKSYYSMHTRNKIVSYEDVKGG